MGSVRITYCDHQTTSTRFNKYRIPLHRAPYVHSHRWPPGWRHREYHPCQALRYRKDMDHPTGRLSFAGQTRYVRFERHLSIGRAVLAHCQRLPARWAYIVRHDSIMSARYRPLARIAIRISCLICRRGFFNIVGFESHTPFECGVHLANTNR